MGTDARERSSSVEGDDRFATTHWSLVVAAGKRQEPDGEAALAALCETYWYPLYAYLRRRGYDAPDAQDLTQGFFAKLLEKDYLDDADQQRGRFRSFLITALKRYVSKQREHASAQKRGGNRKRLSFDFEAGESHYRIEPSHDSTPDRIFDRRWALTVLDNSLTKLRQDYETSDKSRLFESLKVFLTGEKGNSCKQVAEVHNMTEGAVKAAVHRLRKKYRELIRAEIAKTVADPGDIDDELRSLQAALRSENS